MYFFREFTSFGNCHLLCVLHHHHDVVVADVVAVEHLLPVLEIVFQDCFLVDVAVAAVDSNVLRLYLTSVKNYNFSFDDLGDLLIDLGDLQHFPRMKL
jgi:hypothetical protein